MARNKLTAGRIREFECPTGTAQAFLWDTEAPGLAVRATPGSEARGFIFQSRLNGKALRLTIGNVRAWGIDAARAEARRLQTLIDQGIDPRQERADRRAAIEAKALAVEAARNEAERVEAPALEAWNVYLASRPKWSPRTLLDHQRLSDPGGKPKTRCRKAGEGDTTQPGALIPLLNRPLAQIDGDTVRAWLQVEVARRPTQARNAFVRLRAFLKWCSDRPEYQAQIDGKACASRLANDEMEKPTPKDDCLQREMLALWFEHVRQLANPVHSAYLQTTLLTGTRREEVASIAWADVDFQWKSLTIKDKVEGQRIIPLAPYGAALLAALPRRDEWVFSSPTAESGRLQEPRSVHNKALAAAGLPALSLHGLRRSFGTLAEWVECPVGVVAQIQGRKPSATAEKHYRRRPLDLLRMWHIKIEAWILEQAGIEQPAEGATTVRRAIK